ncbi:Putative transposable element, partial [Caligus rogercresseyi]
KMPPYFFKPGEKVDTAAYYKVLDTLCCLGLSYIHPYGNPTLDPGWRTVQPPQGKSRFLSYQHGRFMARRHVAKFDVLESHACKTSHANLTSLQQAIVKAGTLDEEYIQEELHQRPTSCRGRHRQQRRSH